MPGKIDLSPCLSALSSGRRGVPCGKFAVQAQRQRAVRVRAEVSADQVIHTRTWCTQHRRPSATACRSTNDWETSWAEDEEEEDEVDGTSDTEGSSSTDDNMYADISAPHTLSSEQEAILKLVKLGKNVFFTGNAGTGKSYLLREIVRLLRHKYGEDNDSVAVCASTGIAATHIGGTTVHSAFGLFPPKWQPDFDNCWKMKETRRRMRGWKVLVVDEISMVSGEMLQTLERGCRQMRGSRKPFGGLQLVLCGDFLQMPPILGRWSNRENADCFLNRGYTFQAPAWNQGELELHLLTQVFRQKDSDFTDILQAVRYNSKDVKPKLEMLKARCSRDLPAIDGIEATLLFARNDDVNNVNEDRLKELPAREVVFEAENSVEAKKLFTDADQMANAKVLREHSFFKDCLAADEIKLKKGAQVMLLRNLDLKSGPEEMLVNGSRGVVTGFQKYKGKQEGVEMRGAESVDSWYNELIPIVKFWNGRELAIHPFKFSTEVTGYGKCFRKQIPLKLAYAITIHKCQGMTLDYVKVNMKRIFAPGQAYVALSRARSLEGLQVVDVSARCIKTSPVAKRFHECLEAGELYVEEEWESLMELPPPYARKPNERAWGKTEFDELKSEI